MLPQNRIFTYLWVLLLVGLGACQNKPIVLTIAAAPSVPAIVSSSHTSVPTSFITMTATAAASPIPAEATIPLHLPTNTLVPTGTPTAAATTSDYSRGMLLRISKQGQLAYIDERSLHVEHPIHSRQFQIISGQLGDAIWSPDGSKLLYTEWSENGEGQLYLWFAEEGATHSLPELGIPLPGPIVPDYDQIHPCFDPGGQWLPDSQRILLPMRLEQDTNAGTDKYATLIDLKDKTFEVLSPIHNTRGCTAPINNDLFLQVMVYSNASVVEALNYAGEQLWTRMIDRLFLSDLIRANDDDFPLFRLPRMGIYHGSTTR